MNILFVIDTMNAGGAARVTSILANELANRGYNISIATNLSTRKCSYFLDNSIKLLNIYGFRVNSLKLFKLIDHIIRLRKIVKSIRPDVIIGEQENGIVYAKIASLCMNIPIVGHRHNSFKILGLSKIQRLIFNSVNVTVLLHNSDVAYVANSIKNVQAIYNPCSYSINPLNQFDKKKIIAIVGSTKRYKDKGFDIALKIWGQIAKDYPGWTLKIIGGGSHENEMLLKKMAISLGIQNRVIFTGFINDVDKKLLEASVFLLTSRVEGFPMVINEAISQGCACASFSLYGVMEELYTGNAVCFVQDGDIEGFKNVLRNMLDDVDFRNQLSQTAQKELHRYLPNEVIKDWIKLIESFNAPN